MCWSRFRTVDLMECILDCNVRDGHARVDLWSTH